MLLKALTQHTEAVWLVCVQTQASSERFVDEVEKRWGVKFPKGRNPDLTFMAHLWEPLRFASAALHCLCAATPVVGIAAAAVADESVLLLGSLQPGMFAFPLLLLYVCLPLHAVLPQPVVLKDCYVCSMHCILVHQSCM